MPYGYFVALFDVLGFSRKLATIGLDEMLARYTALIDAVMYRKKQISRVFDEMRFKEAPYWAANGDVFLFTKVHGAYASDSLLLWAPRNWPDARGKDVNELTELSKDPAKGWAFQPIPCDNFLDVCNDLICHGLEVGLPLRGALSMGVAVFNEKKNIFLGQPIIDAARLERGQRMIGGSLCKTFVCQTIPKRYLLQFEEHLKDDYAEQYGGFVLDWPRHWRRTRTRDLAQVIQGLNKELQYSSYCGNTLSLVTRSLSFASQFESTEETAIRSLYPAFSRSNDQLAVSARPVRRVPIKLNTTER